MNKTSDINLVIHILFVILCIHLYYMYKRSHGLLKEGGWVGGVQETKMTKGVKMYQFPNSLNDNYYASIIQIRYDMFRWKWYGHYKCSSSKVLYTMHSKIMTSVMHAL